MNEVQIKLAELQQKGWTLAALADELGVTKNAVEKWKAGDRYPTNPKAVLAMLDQITKKKRIPKKRRYGNG
jgi:transcriptional regulator with XRE-family HTH domain